MLNPVKMEKERNHPTDNDNTPEINIHATGENCHTANEKTSEEDLKREAKECKLRLRNESF